jgi:serine/threonine protein kinase
MTKEQLSEEARFILQTLQTDARHSKPSTLVELQKTFENQISLKLLDYVQFLEKYGYLVYNRKTNMVEVTREGEQVVSGEKFPELTSDAEYHFGARMGHPDVQNRGEVLDKRYEKQSVIGSGGIGTVYLGRQLNLDREVAIKEIRELFNYFVEQQRREIIRRFDESVQQHARIQHPNIVAILDINAQREYPYFVMEHAGGGNLRRLLAYAEEFPVELGIKYFLQICHALRAAHEREVVHRDLKPENVLLDLHGNAKVSDFGIARIVERDSAAIHQVYVGMGSVAYMAPEQIGDPRAASPQSDIYALGILFYELLTRKLPGRRSPMPSQVNPDIPKVVDDIFDRMTRDGHEERYASIDEVLDDFYRSDQTLKFIDRRVAVLFGESPVSRLVLHEPDYDELGRVPDGAGDRSGVPAAGTTMGGAGGPAVAAHSAAATPAAGVPAISSPAPVAAAPSPVVVVSSASSSSPAAVPAMTANSGSVLRRTGQMAALVSADTESTASGTAGSSSSGPSTPMGASLPSAAALDKVNNSWSSPGDKEPKTLGGDSTPFTSSMLGREDSFGKRPGAAGKAPEPAPSAVTSTTAEIDDELDAASMDMEALEEVSPAPSLAADEDKEKPKRGPLARPLYSSLNQPARRPGGKDKEK